jgi:hypothetical protein
VVAFADKLTERIDALADALRAADVPQERIAAVLSSAATATMHALVLDAVLDDNNAPAELPEQPAREQQPLQAAA